MEKYLPSDDILALSFPKEVDTFEVLLFCKWNDVFTVSDLLKIGPKVRGEAIFNSLVEDFKRNNIKFDDELSKKELGKRNKERNKMKMDNSKENNRKIREILKKGVEELNLSPSINRRLKQHSIYTIEELIDSSNYIFLNIIDSDIFSQSDIRKISESLAVYGLRLNTNLEELYRTIGEETKEEAEVTEVVAKPEKKERKVIPWKDRMEYITVFNQYFGHVFIPESFEDADEIGKWVIGTRYRLNKGKLSSNKVDDLKAINFPVNSYGRKKSLKEAMLSPLGIKDIKVKDGILFTYYLDGSIKSTADEEFINLLNNFEEKSISEEKSAEESYEDIFEEDTLNEVAKVLEDALDEMEKRRKMPEEESIEVEPAEKTEDSYSVISSKIEEMKAKREALEKEIERKRQMISEYKSLVEQLNNLYEESNRLDEIARNISGLSDLEDQEVVLPEKPKTADELGSAITSLTEAIKIKNDEVSAKKAKIEEYRTLEEELSSVQAESDELDSELNAIYESSYVFQKRKGDK